MNSLNFTRIKAEFWGYILVVVWFLINCFVFYKHSTAMMVDVGREYLVPSAILDGKVLYREILNIYGPLGFYINAFLFQVFGESFRTLYSAGIVAAFAFITAVYFLTREFVGQKISAAVSITIISYAIFSHGIFSYIFPYSYSLVYSLTLYTLGSFFLIKFYKTDKMKFAYFASFFSGFAICCKYEYCWLAIITAATFISLKKMNVADFLKNFGVFLVTPVISLIVMISPWGGG